MTGDAADLDEAIDKGREAASAVNEGSPSRAGLLTNLGAALQGRYERADDPADLDEAIELLRMAASATPDGHLARARHLTNLGLLLRIRSERPGGAEDRAMAHDAWCQAATLPAAPIADRVIAARLWGLVTALGEQWPGAADGYGAAVHLLPRLIWRGVSRRSQEELLADWPELARDGAACAVAAGQVQRAASLLEQGRAFLWTQLLETRTDVARLRDAVPDLADRLAAVGAALDDLDSDVASQPFDRPR